MCMFLYYPCLALSCLAWPGLAQPCLAEPRQATPCLANQGQRTRTAVYAIAPCATLALSCRATPLPATRRRPRPSVSTRTRCRCQTPKRYRPLPCQHHAILGDRRHLPSSAITTPFVPMLMPWRFASASINLRIVSLRFSPFSCHRTSSSIARYSSSSRTPTVCSLTLHLH